MGRRREYSPPAAEVRACRRHATHRRPVIPLRRRAITAPPPAPPSAAARRAVPLPPLTPARAIRMGTAATVAAADTRPENEHASEASPSLAYFLIPLGSKRGR